MLRYRAPGKKLCSNLRICVTLYTISMHSLSMNIGQQNNIDNSGVAYVGLPCCLEQRMCISDCSPTERTLRPTISPPVCLFSNIHRLHDVADENLCCKHKVGVEKYTLYTLHCLVLYAYNAIAKNINGASYCDRCCRSVVCPSLRLSHSCTLQKPSDGMRCYLTVTFARPQVALH